MPNRETQIFPNELLVRWDDSGVLNGAHVVFLGKVLNDDGSVLAAQPLPPQSITLGEAAGFPLTDILEQVHIDALKQVEALKKQVESLNHTMALMDANQQQQIDQLLGRNEL